MNKLCSKENCGKELYARGLCQNHYNNFLYHRNKDNPINKIKKSITSKNYYDSNKERILELQKIRREKNIDLIRAKVREATRNYRKRNPMEGKIYRAKLKNNPELLQKIYLNSKEYRQRLRLKVIAYYSNNTNKCKICGFSDIRALVIDHVNDDGYLFKRANSNKRENNTNTFRRIVREGYPKGFQVLCFNCNYIKEDARREKEFNYRAS